MDIDVRQEGPVAIIEMRRPPNNFLDLALIRDLAASFEAADNRDDVRSIVLCAEGRNFCAGVNFGVAPATDQPFDPAPFYHEALRLFRCGTPVVAAVQGAAVGAGLGLALMADFRVGTPETRFCANFTRIGIHPGFGLTVTLPRLVGAQQAALLFYTGRRIDGNEALGCGLVDILADPDGLRTAAIQLATEIAQAAPLALTATRRTLRHGLADQVAAALAHEATEQKGHFATQDFREGVTAGAERRLPQFKGC
ncbi:enoyl-CoA hydratase/isomerase family protein [Niveispirillum sp.]|uniref:enoyl-CoA hydratase/isomerase family protein n=1 Tax=Niveispirillum sp. TaxID=1917217 RepID=UPI001B3FB7D6|nr:enoyl-CoA hydratase/isomerase family protein [Niveispirillum sp.]MBP7340433.1 enoyl-CoA hydratase/isomerase family protein [Niveispirillum sp.]